MMFSKDNPHSLGWICGCISGTSLFVIAIATVYLIMICLGIGAWAAVYSGKYDMHNGTSLTPGDKSHLICYAYFRNGLFGGCIRSGLFYFIGLMIYCLFVMLVCMIPYGLMELYNKEWKKKSETDETTPLLEDGETTSLLDKMFMGNKDGITIWNIIGIIYVACIAIMLYPIICGLGLGFSYVIYANDYNMQTGWLKSGVLSQGQLTCYDSMGRSIFFGCIPLGYAAFAILGVGSIFFFMLIIWPILMCCRNVRDSYNFADKVTSVDPTEISVQDIF